MKKVKESPQEQSDGASVASQTKPVQPVQPVAQPVYQQIKIALDLHPGDLMVVRMVDGAKPQSPQKLPPERFLDWAAKQKSQAREVINLRRTGTPSEKRSSVQGSMQRGSC